MSNKGQWIEVQIRSERMNDVAEQGFAAHWKYKEGGGSEDEGELEKWLRTIKEILDDPQPDAMGTLSQRCQSTLPSKSDCVTGPLRMGVMLEWARPSAAKRTILT